MMVDYSKTTDEDLFFSVGNTRPSRNGLDSLAFDRTEEQLRAEQKEFDEAVEEMKRRDSQRGFPFVVPKGMVSNNDSY